MVLFRVRLWISSFSDASNKVGHLGLQKQFLIARSHIIFTTFLLIVACIYIFFAFHRFIVMLAYDEIIMMRLYDEL